MFVLCKALILSLFYLVVFSFFFFFPSLVVFFLSDLFIFHTLLFLFALLERCVSCLQYGEVPSGVQDGKHPVVSLGVLPTSTDVLLTHGTSPVFCSVKCASCLVPCHTEIFSLLFFFLQLLVWHQNR